MTQLTNSVPDSSNTRFDTTAIVAAHLLSIEALRVLFTSSLRADQQVSSLWWLRTLHWEILTPRDVLNIIYGPVSLEVVHVAILKAKNKQTKKL